MNALSNETTPVNETTDDESTTDVSKESRRARRILRAIAIAGVLLVLVGAVVARKPLEFLAFGFDLPKPTGKYLVGRQTWDIVCADRPETFSSDPSAKREIRTDVYYPAKAGAAKQTGAYLDPEITQAVTGMPPFLISKLRTNWMPDAEPDRAGAPYPVLLFSPGLESPPVFYTSLLEQLVSRGFVIVALWHPFTTSRTIFPNGKIIESKFEANGAMWEGDEATREVAKQRVSQVWADDMRSALDEAVRRNGDGALKGMFDLSRVGAFGHSFGGQNAAAAMTLDSRIRAGLNMDGTSVYKPILDKGVSGAFAMLYDTFSPPEKFLNENGISEEQWWKNFTERNCPFAVQENASKFYIYQIEGLDHEGFSTDLPLLRKYFPFAISEDMVGTLDGSRVLPIVSSLIGDFFDVELSGAKSELLCNPEAVYPEVHVGMKGHPDSSLTMRETL